MRLECLCYKMGGVRVALVPTKTSLKFARLTSIGLILALLFLPFGALADQYDDQIAALKVQISGNNSSINGLKAQEDTLNNKLAIINSQISTAVAELGITQTKYDQTSAQLDQAKADLVKNRAILDENLRVIYEEGNVTPIEVVASSDNFSDLVGREQYLESLQEKVQTTVKKITDLKASLEAESAELSTLLSQQQAQESALADERASAAQLLAETQGQEASYQAQVAAETQGITKLQAQQLAAREAYSTQITASGCGGYPANWCSDQKDSYNDYWGYPIRECTSYAAWWRNTVGVTQGLSPIPSNMGNATDWVSSARHNGLRVDSSPQVGAVAVASSDVAPPYGHVMIVRAVEGSQVLVGQYNYGFTGRYSEGLWNISVLSFIH